MSLVIPKVIGVTSFSYWQLFIFYSTYVGIAHFGITDGIYLIVGGKDIKDINKKYLSNTFWFIILIQISIGSLILLLTNMNAIDINIKFILNMVSLYMIFANATWFMEFLFQATDNIKEYAKLTIFSRLFFILLLPLLFMNFVKSYKFLIDLFVISQGIASLYGVYKLREYIFYVDIGLTRVGKYVKFILNTSNSGIKVTVSNTVNFLILGIGQFMVENHWGITTFGKLSFTFSLVTFILQFVSQFSLVFFPSLRKLDNDNRKTFFENFLKLLNLALPMVVIGYIPLKILLNWWMPQYSISFFWMAFLIPVCLFDGKMNILFSVVLKVERREDTLLKYNCIALLLSFILIFFSAYIINSLILVPIAITISLFIRSFLSERYLINYINIQKNVIITIKQILFIIIFYLSLLTNNDVLIFMTSIISYYFLCFNRLTFEWILNNIKIH